MPECSDFFWDGITVLELLWDGLDQLFEVEAKLRAADSRDATDATVGDALGEQTLDFSLFFG